MQWTELSTPTVRVVSSGIQPP